MAVIDIRYHTNEIRGVNHNQGSYEVKLFAGLDEEPEVVFNEGLERLKAALSGIPKEKRYPRLHVEGLDEV